MGEQLLSVTKKSSAVFLGKILGVAILFLFNFIVAKGFGAESYGEFTYVFTYISFIPIISVIGLDQGLIFFLPRLKEKDKLRERSNIIGFAFISVIIIWSLIATLIISNSSFLALNLMKSPAYEQLINVLMPMSLFIVLINLIYGIFRGLESVRYNIICENIIIPVSKIIVIIPFIFLWKTPNAIIISFYISFIAGTVYLFKKLLSYKNIINFKFTKGSIYKEIISFSFPIILTSILYFFISKISIFMIGYFLSSKEVGIYNIALQVGSISSFVLVAFNTIFAPTISSLYYKGEMDKLSYMYKSITKWVVTVNLVVFSLILLFSNNIMHLFGTEYMLGAGALILIALGEVVNAATGSVGIINTMTGHPEYEIYIGVVVVLVNLFISYFLIPIWGISGAATGSLVSVWLSNFIRLALVYKNHKMHPYNLEYLKIIFACFVSFLAVYMLKSMVHIIWNVELFLYSGIYIIIFVFVNIVLGVSEADKDIIKRLCKK